MEVFMSDRLDSLKALALSLPSGERAELAHLLIDSLDDEPEGDVEAAWDAELARRAEEIRSGRVVGKPADQVFSELRGRSS
jgi:putative addiction module component (TIGR02574 family)